MGNDIAIAILGIGLGAGLGIWALLACMKAFLRHLYHCAECKDYWTSRFDEHADRSGKCWWKALQKETKEENT